MIKGKETNDEALTRTIDGHVNSLLDTYVFMGYERSIIASLFVSRFNKALFENIVLLADIKNLDNERAMDANKIDLEVETNDFGQSIMTATKSAKTNSENLGSLKAKYFVKYQEIQGKIKDNRPYSTTDATEKKAIKAFSFSASLIDRFPFSKDKLSNTDLTAGKVISAMDNLGSDTPSESEIRCLKKLKDKTHLNFEFNSTLYHKGCYSGTPDALHKQDGVVIGVAEFKSAKLEKQGKNQLKFYMHLFDLQEGYLVLDNETDPQVDKILLKPADTEKLGKRVSLFNQFNTVILPAD